ncbi:MAG TPA: ester cyclase [Nocardioidaceae bacterium]|nr:ester cyclase [Nocardioidaceae bacterium]
MSSKKSSENAALGRQYVEALFAQDLDTATACWGPEMVDDLVGIARLTSTAEVRAIFQDMYAAVPDMIGEIESVTADDERVVVLWRVRGTFGGTGKFLGLKPNGRPMDMQGVDVLTVRDGKLVRNTSLTNAAELARQLAVLPPADGKLEKTLYGLVNLAAPLGKRIRERRTRR